MSDLNPDITPEMIERAAERIHYGECSCGGFAEHDAEDQFYTGIAQHALSAALAGRVPVALPGPTGEDEDGKFWSVEAAGHEYYGYVADNGQALVSLPFDDLTADETEADALARLAAAREARRLATHPTQS